MPKTKHPSHSCAGCPTKIPTFLLACVRCWPLVPRATKNALYAEQRKCKLAGINHSDALIALRAQAIDELRKARTVCPA